MILDTSTVIDRYKSGEEVDENICIVTCTEFPPILDSGLMNGEIYTLTPEDQVLAIRIQKKLRSEGNAVPAPDLLIAAAAINRGEKLDTEDQDFKTIAEASELRLVE